MNKLWFGLIALSMFLFTANVVYHELLLKQHTMVDSHALQLHESKKVLVFAGNDEPAKIPAEKKGSKTNEVSKSVVNDASNEKHVEEDGDKDGQEHDIAGLSCARYGGPSDEVAHDMVYWEDIPSDSKYVSPFYEAGNEKYMTFEPDGGEFINWSL